MTKIHRQPRTIAQWLTFFYLSNMDVFKDIRQSKMFLEEVYFWTNTACQWKHLLKPDKYKDLIIESLTYLVQHGKIWLIWGTKGRSVRTQALGWQMQPQRATLCLSKKFLNATI